MNKYLSSISAIVGILMSTSIANAQYCYNTLSLNYDATVMEQIGDFIYKGTNDGGRRTGSTNRILIVDIDNVTNKNLQICGKAQPVIDYEKKCVMVKDFDRKLTVAQVREFDGINRPCTSRDLVFIDIIDTKFSLTRLPNCGGLSLKNISIPFQAISQSGDIIPPPIKDTVVGYNNFPETLEGYFPMSINYYKPLTNYLAYEFVVSNLATNVVTVYPSTIGESITLPDENLLVELKIKGIDEKLNQKVRFYKSELRRTINASACNNYQFYNTNYTQSGTYTFTKTNVGKCDSAITLNLTVLKSSTNIITRETCDASFTLNGQTYTSSGNYTQILKNKAGCDSTITLNLKLNKATSSIINQTTCGTYALNGQTYTSSGTYVQTIKNKAGCDSTITLNLKINQATSSTVNQISCNPSFTLNGTTYTTGGNHKQTILNQAGCDSVISLNLTFVKINTEVKVTTNALSAVEINASYYWFDCAAPTVKLQNSEAQIYNPAISANYAVAINKSGCKATSGCVTFRYPLALSELEAKQQITIAPNPTSGMVTLAFGQVKSEATVYLISALGQTVSTLHVENTPSVNIDIQSFPAGLYHIYLYEKGKKAQSFSVVKK